MTNATKPNPIRHPSLAIFDGTVVARQLHCRRYDECVEVAEANDWPGFSCAACAAFEPLTAMEEARDHDGLLDLLAELRLADIVAVDRAA